MNKQIASPEKILERLRQRGYKVESIVDFRTVDDRKLFYREKYRQIDEKTYDCGTYPIYPSAAITLRIDDDDWDMYYNRPDDELPVMYGDWVFGPDGDKKKVLGVYGEVCMLSESDGEDDRSVADFSSTGITYTFTQMGTWGYTYAEEPKSSPGSYTLSGRTQVSVIGDKEPADMFLEFTSQEAENSSSFELSQIYGQNKVFSIGFDFLNEHLSKLGYKVVKDED